VFAVLCLLLHSGTDLYAQNGVVDTTRLLPALVIKDTPSNSTGYGNWQSDSLPVMDVLSLADRLQWESPVAVRANAPGALSTVSSRGAGPARTAVVWEGVNLQSTMNGVVDVSLLPVWPEDRIEIQYGGQSAAQNTAPWVDE